MATNPKAKNTAGTDKPDSKPDSKPDTEATEGEKGEKETIRCRCVHDALIAFTLVEEGVSRDVTMHPGGEYDLPADNKYIRGLVALGRLITV
uniref:Uncharacterized protein n=1 Tax=Candidatus Kentrum sp. LFY TaxID=2126342 RepID=A0A450WGU6_9GAMM|nr:MAG: hypothetical protein BECKLFY1418C_GA0070996_102226 [Candidatus Kentron sp. LFY]